MNPQQRSPRCAEWILRHAAAHDDAPWIVNDLQDEMCARAESTGARAARWWYRRQVALSIAPLLMQRTIVALHTKDRRGDFVWQELRMDARHALRVFARTPLAAVAVTLTMVLGIGVTAAVFSVVDAVLVRPLPFPESARTMQLFGISDGNEIPSLSYPDLMDFERTIPAFARLGIVQRSAATYVGHTEAQQLQMADVDSGFIRVMGLRPAAGRLFASDELTSAGAPVVVLAHAFWQREFGGDPAIVGKTIQIGTTTRRVIGVLPPMAFMYPTGPLDAIVPLHVDEEDKEARGSMWLEALVQLRPGASVDEAQKALSAAAAGIAASHPKEASRRSARLEPLRDAVIGPVSRMLILLGFAVAAVLLTACMNIGNLLLAQASTRGREFAVRAALGGSASRIRRQVLTETLLLASFGGVGGVVLAGPLARGLVSLYPGGLPRAAEVGVDFTVIAVAILSTLTAALLASIPTLRRAAASGLTDSLRGGSGAGHAAGVRRHEGLLIATQVAATLTLVFVAVLMVRTFVSVRRIEPGFDPRDVLTFYTAPSHGRHPTRLDVEQYYGDVDRLLRRVPGVVATTTMSTVPFAPGSQTDSFIRDDVGDRGKDNPRTAVTTAAPGFDRVMHLTLLDGRSLTTGDDSGTPRVVMVNEHFAKHNFAGVDPLGKTIHWNKEQWTIIGVVADAHDKNLMTEAPSMLYASFEQRPRLGRWVIVRTNGLHTEQTQAVRSALHALDPTVPLSLVASLDSRIADSIAAQRFRAWMIGSLGALAAILAVIGVYAIVSQAVTRRTREIGIRIALGQNAGSVQRGVVGSALRVASLGSLAGIASSVVVGRSLSNFLYAVDGQDPTLLLLTASLLLGCCAFASYLPARRASRVDPMIALQAE